MKLFSWNHIFSIEKKKIYFQKIMNYILNANEIGITICPKINDIFNAFYYTKLEELKVVILGQDPYININQAHGLAFSVPLGISIPPSLHNIFKELKNDLSYFQYPNHGCLINWAKNGVFLLNTILTVEQGRSLSHINLGWETFTNKIIMFINQYCFGIVFLLWGKHAQTKKIFIDNTKHYILSTSHPSPLSAHKGFFGCKHFSKTNKILLKQGIKPIDWNNLMYKKY